MVDTRDSMYLIVNPMDAQPAQLSYRLQHGI
jgi:hypothetical protein